MDTLDLFRLEDTLNDEERLVRQTAAAFVDDEFMPKITRHHREATFPLELIPRLGELGFFGATLPERYGCAHIGERAYGLIMQELERGDSGLRSFASVQSSLVMFPIFAFGSETQRMKWLPRLASGEVIGSFGLTEPDHGSDPGAMVTRAERTADGFLLNGAKMWITNGSLADIAVVWAKLDGVVRGFLVEKNTPGFSTVETKGKWSLRASDTSELFFDDCEIPSDAILPDASGLKPPLSCLSQARYGIAWGAIGSALATFHCARDYATTRKQFGREIGRFQIIQERLVSMASDITHAQLLAFRLAELKQKGEAHPALISLAKRNNVAMALNTARLARTILGASGIVDDHPIMRHLMNLESVYTYEGTHDIHTLIIGEYITGFSAFQG